ncbi:hypothetical protein M5K25_016923 [Dendrobium thyrsiflorum]|uniref:Uncharacterized protein n=1 Tax=Dendrobium thyrsiflorum TaxID=117978 RepID=A0ABD0ULS4_DENTH
MYYKINELRSGGDAKRLLGLKQVPSLSNKSSVSSISVDPASSRFTTDDFVKENFVLLDLHSFWAPHAALRL